MSPIAALSNLIPTSRGHKCREDWPSGYYERYYNLLLDVLLLLLPLAVLITTYLLIVRTLWRGIKTQPTPTIPSQREVNGVSTIRKATSTSRSTSPNLLRRTNTERALTNKKRVVKMLCAVVLEFFICWTPLYIINTAALFAPAAVYDRVGYKAISYFQLLAYSSSCCNPVTYCFMNTSFRKAFLNLFGCLRREKPNL